MLDTTIVSINVEIAWQIKVTPKTIKIIFSVCGKQINVIPKPNTTSEVNVSIHQYFAPSLRQSKLHSIENKPLQTNITPNKNL